MDIEATELNVANVPIFRRKPNTSDGYATERGTLATVIQLQRERSIGQNGQNYLNKGDNNRLLGQKLQAQLRQLQLTLVSGLQDKPYIIYPIAPA